MSAYAIFGNPVSHSISPKLHALFAEQFGMSINYQKQLVPLEQFKNTLDLFRTQGGLGANITIPFKTQAFDYADQLTDRAKLTGAVNTFIFKNNVCMGDNTDGVGFIRDLKNNHQFEIANKNILIVGAGGAARGILGEIIREKPRGIGIFNRTVEKTEALIDFFRSDLLYVCEGECECDLIINATNANFQKEFLCNLNYNKAIYYDLNYGDRHRTFFEWAKKNGATHILDGLGMLVEQGAESFFQWFGKRPETKSVIQMLQRMMMKIRQ